MELEHQALIFKYFTVNVPVPSNLLVPVIKALETAAYCSIPAANLRQTYGWGGFHLGFSNNSDPEPGRCRRTDGKKWRCSREAVVDQKYCERHMNRGRHRSRKPVEGLCSGAGSGNGKVSTPAPVVTTVSDIVSPFHIQNQNRGNMGFEKIQDSTCHSMLSPSRFKIQLNSERSQEVSWIPVSWEASNGGPLGEVLNRGTNNYPSALNLMTDGLEISRHTALL
ncbi:hypothetical protein L1987_64169 [Smallanthus sonchifolius]|uniref:Uncharacterized protein n=1 Tax=Smallanthus sonchifolius TaxID=185202 RepID=A0ACB9CFD0_9ASTR|nr:hypothetical protein L1987_64169 [Smallanthus sonchifolius]